MREARPHWLSLSIVFLLNFAATPLGLLAPIPLKIALDSVLGDAPLSPFLAGFFQIGDSRASLLLFACAATFAIMGLQALQGFASWVYQLSLSERLIADSRARIFEHVQRLTLQHHDENGSPDLFYRLQSDVSSMHDLVNYGLIPLLNSLLLFGSLFVITYRLDSTLAILVSSTLPVLWWLTRFFSRRSRDRWADAKSTEGLSVGLIQEVLGQIRVVKAFAAESRETARYRERAGKHTKFYLRAVFNEAVFCLIAALIIAAASAAALWIGVKHVEAKVLTLGNFFVVMAYFAQLFKPVETLSKLSASIQKSFASAERAFALLDIVPSIKEEATAHPMARARGEIEFRSVSFSYRPEQRGLQDVSFHIKPGQRVAVIGPTGSGKTTLINLLVRFLDPAKGSILLDGEDLKQIRLSDLRRQFSIILQEPVLFTGTISENIAYGRPDASKQEILEAAKEAQALDFIERLREGFETVVGERGATLSGGERQRISIARALLVDAPVLVLDEPTSSLDVEREERVIQALAKLSEKRTIITISHRLSLIKDYDVVLRIVDGHVVQERTTPATSSKEFPI